MKKIAVLGASVYNLDVYKILQLNGYYTIGIDANCQAACANIANKFIPLDFSDEQQLLEICRSEEIDAIMPINEWGVLPSAYVCQEMGLIGNSLETANNSTDKGRMRDCWAILKNGNPDYFVFKTFEELQENINQIGYPCIIKPTFSGGGGRGISVVKSSADLKWSFNFARADDQNNLLICEAFMDGLELTIETLSINGIVNILAISDKFKPDLRTRVSTSLNFPANISEKDEYDVITLVKKAVLALGIKNGMAHSEVILTSSGPKMVETGARGGGSHIFPLIIEATSGIPAPLLYAKLLVGEKIKLNETTKIPVIYRFFNPPYGILKYVKNFDEIKSWKGVLALGVTKEPGDIVGDLKNSLERSGYVVVTAASRKDAEKLADKVEQTLEFVTEKIAP
jgi:biotin carboxylase